MKSSASESKPFQSRSKGEIPGRARRKERLRASSHEPGWQRWPGTYWDEFRLGLRLRGSSPSFFLRDSQERTKRERAWKSSPFLAWGDFHARSRFVRYPWGKMRDYSQSSLGFIWEISARFPRREKVRDPREALWHQIRETKQTLCFNLAS